MFRKKKHGTDPGIGLEVPVTPMLDFTFQLLFFFMIYYHPSALEGQIEINLPAHTENKADAVENVKTPNEEAFPQLDANLTVVLRPRLDDSNFGAISEIIVKKSPDPDTTIGDPRHPEQQLDELRAYLERERPKLDNKEGVKIEGDTRLRLDAVVAVIDACKKAGFSRIDFPQPSDLVGSQ